MVCFLLMTLFLVRVLRLLYTYHTLATKALEGHMTANGVFTCVSQFEDYIGVCRVQIRFKSDKRNHISGCNSRT